MRVTTAAEMRELDRLAIETYGIPGVVLMENAGAQVVRILWQEYPHLQARRVAILCGRGNNGGDGFVIARYLHTKGVSVRCSSWENPEVSMAMPERIWICCSVSGLHQRAVTDLRVGSDGRGAAGGLRSPDRRAAGNRSQG